MIVLTWFGSALRVTFITGSIWLPIHAGVGPLEIRKSAKKWLASRGQPRVRLVVCRYRLAFDPGRGLLLVLGGAALSLMRTPQLQYRDSILRRWQFAIEELLDRLDH